MQLTLAAGLVAATLLQFVGALCVRDYARGLWLREEFVGEEERGDREERVERGEGVGRMRGLSVIFEEGEEKY